MMAALKRRGSRRQPSSHQEERREALQKTGAHAEGKRAYLSRTGAHPGKGEGRDAYLRKLFGLHPSTMGSSASILPPAIAVHIANDDHVCSRASQADTRVEGTGGHAR